MSQFFVNGCNTYIIGSAIRTDNVEILNRILLIPGLDLQTLINIHKVNASIQRNNIEILNRILLIENLDINLREKILSLDDNVFGEQLLNNNNILLNYSVNEHSISFRWLRIYIGILNKRYNDLYRRIKKKLDNYVLTKIKLENNIGNSDVIDYIYSYFRPFEI